MTTPEPRLSDRRSRDPNPCSSPKKYRKNGSLPNGELVVRTTCSEEMFATPLTATAATFEKSGNPPVIVTGGALTGGAVTGAGAAVCATTGAAATGDCGAAAVAVRT